jgi:hypothetical protein
MRKIWGLKVGGSNIMHIFQEFYFLHMPFIFWVLFHCLVAFKVQKGIKNSI